MKQLKLGDFENYEKIIVFDLETQKGFHETKHINEMLVAVGVSYDFKAKEYKIFTEENIQELIGDIFSADLIVGYNIVNFDYNVLKGYTNKSFRVLKTLDIMKHVEKPLGFRPKLNNLVEATLGEAKSADGLQSLQWFKEGKIQKIIEYCQQDVKVTKNLYEFGKENGFVYANSWGSKIQVPVMW